MNDNDVQKNGSPFPLGITILPQGIHFSIHCKHAESLFLLIFHPKTGEVAEIHALSKKIHPTGSIFHIFIENLTPPFDYAYKIERKGKKPLLLLDPYAKELTSHGSPSSFGKENKKPLLGSCFKKKSFSFKKHKPLPMKDLIIYEMHVRAFTLDPSSKVKNKGSFLGIIEKIPYLKKLGINAIELMPIFEWEETSYTKTNSKGETLCNFWGYSPISFFALMNKYASTSKKGAAFHEFRELVKAFHKNNIEVIVDVVLNHTGESDNNLISLRGLDKEGYYLLNKKGYDMNFSGCGNTMNCNHSFTEELLLESLRYLVTEFHIDGIRFDLAPILLRQENGDPSFHAPLLQKIVHDPVLSTIKLIAEPWDAAGLYLLGQFAPLGKNWYEWNGKYRDSVRKFLKGDIGQNREFATRLSGSQDIYSFPSQQASSSINFITCHDGFSLTDLVSYNEKHNLENGENNQDGNNNNDSFNFGEEGPSLSPSLLALRKRAIKNSLLALFISKGVPMLTMGDEYGHTKQGNNNTWCQDNALTHFQWDSLKKNQDLFLFTKKLIQFRHENSLFRKKEFLTSEDVLWLNGTLKEGSFKSADIWEDPHFIAYILKEEKHAYFIAFNSSHKEAFFTIPEAPFSPWKQLILTASPSPLDFYDQKNAPVIKNSSFSLSPFSALLFTSFKLQGFRS